jgi:hypothetical protein
LCLICYDYSNEERLRKYWIFGGGSKIRLLPKSGRDVLKRPREASEAANRQAVFPPKCSLHVDCRRGLTMIQPIAAFAPMD